MKDTFLLTVLGMVYILYAAVLLLAWTIAALVAVALMIAVDVLGDALLAVDGTVGWTVAGLVAVVLTIAVDALDDALLTVAGEVGWTVGALVVVALMIAVDVPVDDAVAKVE